MPSQTITLAKAKLTDDDYAIDAANASPGNLKSLCLAWHGNAQGTIPSTLVTNQSYIEIPALRSSVVQRSASYYDSHLVVSKPIFDAMRAALVNDRKLALTIEHGTGLFSFYCFASIMEADPYLLTISETLKTTNGTVLQLQQDVATIKELLTNAHASRGPAGVLDLAKRNGGGYDEYGSSGGAAQS